jgi:Cu/Ag efflux pump CusA
MVSGLIHWCLHHRFLVIVTAIAVLAYGYYALLRTNRKITSLFHCRWYLEGTS